MRSSLLPWLVGFLAALGACAQSEDSNLSVGNGGNAGSGSTANGGTAGNGGSDSSGGTQASGGSGNVGNTGGGGVGGSGAAGAGTGGAGNAGSSAGGAGNAGSGAGGAGNAGSGSGGVGNAGSGSGGAGNAGSGAGGTGAGGSGSGCTQLPATPIYVIDESGPYIYFSNAPNIGDSTLQDVLFFEFYANSSGTFNLTSAGDNDNYETCTQCIVLFQDANVSTVEPVFYQTAGSITVSGSPSSGTPQITLNNVTLSEVTIDSANNYHSTLVPGGGCYTISTPTTATASLFAPEDSCVGFCEYSNGSFPAGNCYCDYACLSAGDCCSDYTAVCP
ncbi:MAG: hypothetical protein H6718_06395 [Polyangiaceae bacterium]|nr:hypothetical protein [Myxococcales bacterium]MCB9585008.1 hypothetical protein [Polyangiaceae bacterium]